MAYGSHTSNRVGQQVSELRKWIEEAMKEEQLAASRTVSLATDPSAQNLEIPGVELGNDRKKAPKKKSRSRSKSKGPADSEKNPAEAKKKGSSK